MSKPKKIFYSIWTGLTLILLLFSWWQTQRLINVSTERNRIRYTSLRTLLDESQQILDAAARQSTGSPTELNQAKSNVDTALALLDAAARVATSTTASDIRSEWDALSDLRMNIGSDNQPSDTPAALRSEADKIRRVTQDFISRQ